MENFWFLVILKPPIFISCIDGRLPPPTMGVTQFSVRTKFKKQKSNFQLRKSMESDVLSSKTKLQRPQKIIVYSIYLCNLSFRYKDIQAFYLTFLPLLAKLF